MVELAYNDWQDSNDQNPKKLGHKLYDQVNRARRHYARELSAGLMGTQSDYSSSYTIVNSGPGLASYQNTLVNGAIDISGWINPDKWELPIEIFPYRENYSVSNASKRSTSIAEWVSFIRSNLVFLESSTKLAARILMLANEQEYNDSIRINKFSLENFVMFLSSNKIVKNPFIGINNDGNIDALWRGSKETLIGIVFKPGDESQLVTFSHDLIIPGKINKRAATLPIKSMIDVIKSRKLNTLLYG